MEPDGEFILGISLKRATAIGEKNKSKTNKEKKKKHLTDFTTHNKLPILSTLPEYT